MSGIRTSANAARTAMFKVLRLSPLEWAGGGMTEVHRLLPRELRTIFGVAVL